MAKKKGLHVSDKTQYLAYKNERRWAKNREKKLIKHISDHPNDMVASKAFSSDFVYRRKKPGNNGFPKQKHFGPIKYGYGMVAKSFGEKLKEAMNV